MKYKFLGEPLIRITGSSRQLISTIPEKKFKLTARPKTGILMLNMGGPTSTDQVQQYLLRIMTDRDMIQLPVQRYEPFVSLG